MLLKSEHSHASGKLLYHIQLVHTHYIFSPQRGYPVPQMSPEDMAKAVKCVTQTTS